jgi:hypothetical protein
MTLIKLFQKIIDFIQRDYLLHQNKVKEINRLSHDEAKKLFFLSLDKLETYSNNQMKIIDLSEDLNFLFSQYNNIISKINESEIGINSIRLSETYDNMIVIGTFLDFKILCKLNENTIYMETDGEHKEPFFCYPSIFHFILLFMVYGYDNESY